MSRAGGVIGFFTIHIPEGLSEDAYRRAVLAGPTYVEAGGLRQDELLRRAGFRGIEEIDLTGEFLEVCRALVRARERHAEELSRLQGEAKFNEQMKRNRLAVAAVEAGLLRRALFIARR